jgi:hypothetical protein
MIEISGLVMLQGKTQSAIRAGYPGRRTSVVVRSAEKIDRLAGRHNKAATGVDDALLVRCRNGSLFGRVRAPWQRRPYLFQAVCEIVRIPGLERPGALHSRCLLSVYGEIGQ